nr:MAG: HemK-related putative methylase [Candidatus Nanosalinarum sp. J07AB56]
MVYRPREDSRLLKQAVTSLDLEDKKFLDMGTGTGYIAEAALEQGADVTAVDIDPEAVDRARDRLPSNADVIQSDLFTDVQNDFDVMAFNPPYLPESRGGSTATVSGRDGARVSQRFLGECTDHLEDDGVVVLVVSSRNGLATEGFETLCATDLWFERLKVVRVQDRF